MCALRCGLWPPCCPPVSLSLARSSVRRLAQTHFQRPQPPVNMVSYAATTAIASSAHRAACAAGKHLDMSSDGVKHWRRAERVAAAGLSVGTCLQRCGHRICALSARHMPCSTSSRSVRSLITTLLVTPAHGVEQPKATSVGSPKCSSYNWPSKNICYSVARGARGRIH